MNDYVVVCTFAAGTTPQAIADLVAEEQVIAARLQAAGRLGAVRISMARRTVFLDVAATDEQAARRTVEELPMATLWDLEVFPVTAPG
jgi:muconolactone delta-isomerase